MVLKYSPNWSGAKETRKPVWIPPIVHDYFHMVEHEEFDLMVPFTKETWHGRMRACRGVGASLSEAELAKWDEEHRKLLDKIAPDKFDILHYAAYAILERKS